MTYDEVWAAVKDAAARFGDLEKPVDVMLMTPYQYKFITDAIDWAQPKSTRAEGHDADVTVFGVAFEILNGEEAIFMRYKELKALGKNPAIVQYKEETKDDRGSKDRSS